MQERNIKLVIEYDGTMYHGWQSQNNAVAIANIVSTAVTRLTGENTKLIGASRTDAGVHANGQVANFKTRSKIPAEKFSFALNTILPDDIVIQHSEEVDDDFNARFCSTGKRYQYVFYNHRMPSALYRHRAYHICQALDIEAMQLAAKYFEGTHDFSAFRSSGCSASSTIRTIAESKVFKKENFIVFEVSGTGFLYHMVRILAGTLSYVGLEKYSPEEMTSLLRSKDRRKSGKTAPAHGLYLTEVFY